MSRQQQTHRNRLKVAVICPFWGSDGHAGMPRIERFVRWLQHAGASIVVVAAGCEDDLSREEAIVVYRSRDPLGLYRTDPDRPAPAPRRPNRFRRMLSYLLFVPDPSRVWASRLAANRKLLEVLQGTTHVLASSPPESVHPGAARLARRLGAQYIMDMRDGWLDEPLRPLLQRSALRRWLERRLEARCIAAAAAILVTSDSWRSLLSARYRLAEPRIRVLTNAYPPTRHYPPAAPVSAGLLVHAGRFEGSDPRRRPAVLLEPLLSAVCRNQSLQGEILLPGAHTPGDLLALESFATEFAAIGWKLRISTPISRPQLLSELNIAGGLLLLSASRAQIPGKLFEYLPTGRPILALVPGDGATWRLCEALEQVFLVDAGNPGAFAGRIDEFLAAAHDDKRFPVPPEYSEDALAEVFLSSLVTPECAITADDSAGAGAKGLNGKADL